MEEFSRQIKNYRLFCKLQLFTLQLSLINFQEQQLFQTNFNNETLPESVNKTCVNVKDFFVFLKEKVKRFKFDSQGKLTCFPYIGKGDRIIQFEMQRQIMIGFQESQKYMNLFKLQLKRLSDSQKKCLKIIKQQKTKIDLLQAKIKKMDQDKSTKIKNTAKNGKKYTIDHKEDQKQYKFSQNRRRKGKQPTYTYTEEYEVSQEQNKGIEDFYYYENAFEQQNGQIYSVQAKKQKASLVKPKIKKQLGQKYDFLISKTCPFIDKFKVFFSEVQRIISTDSYQLYGKEPLKKGKSYFCCLLKKLKYNNIIIGVIVEDLLSNKDSNSCNGCICYDGYYGIVLNNGVEAQEQYPKISEGNILRVSIDYDQRKIEWLIEYQIIAKAQIPEKMLNSNMFPYFELFDKGDTIVLNIEG